jgi:hypothetical protein
MRKSSSTNTTITVMGSGASRPSKSQKTRPENSDVVSTK